MKVNEEIWLDDVCWHCG